MKEKKDFRIERMELKGFRGCPDKTIADFSDLTPKLITLFGNTGTCKTRTWFYLYTAIFALLGSRNLCQKEGWVKLDFSMEGKRYEVRRGRDESGNSYVSLKIDGKSFSGNAPEIE
jgi:hypothetical protein